MTRARSGVLGLPLQHPGELPFCVLWHLQVQVQLGERQAIARILRLLGRGRPEVVQSRASIVCCFEEQLSKAEKGQPIRRITRDSPLVVFNRFPVPPEALGALRLPPSKHIL